MYRLISLFVVVFLIASCRGPQEINLEGSWMFRADPEDIGISENWFDQELPDSIYLPGSMASNGFGDKITLETEWMGGMRNPNWYTDPNYAPYFDPDNVRLPYWLQPDKKYTGASWYQKEIDIPDEWVYHELRLVLERVHWESQLWFDDQLIGIRNSLGAPHIYIIPSVQKPGKHRITVRIDNRMKEIDVGWDSHSVSDHTQTNWNGMIGNLSLEKVDKIRFENLQIEPIQNENAFSVSGVLVNETDQLVNGKVSVRLTPVLNQLRQGKSLNYKHKLTLKSGRQSITFKIKSDQDLLEWDEFDPVLYEGQVALQFRNHNPLYEQTIGVRTIEARPEGIFVNDRRTFLRGTLECAIFPLTGYPSTHPEDWIRIMKIIKEHGLNHMRFHSWCPPEAAFEAADQEGIYLQVECSSWANSTSAIGDGQPIDQFIWDESKRIIANYGHHPSFVMMAYGNEPAGQNQVAFLTEFVTYWQKHAPNRLYTGAAGWPQLEVNDYHNIPRPRIQGWGEQLNSIINATPPSSSYDWSDRIKNTVKKINPKSQIPSPNSQIPIISHEIGQWCVYPDFKEIEQYTGVLKPRNFEIFQESLKAHGMLQLADSFLLASGKLQALCYKADIEAALRTPGFGGFQLLDLQDFPGQGTALVGILNPFWREKGYISPEEFSQFCNDVVPLARLPKHLYFEGDTLQVPLQVACYNKTGDPRPKTKIRLKTQDGKIEVEQEIDVGDLKTGQLNDIGILNYPLEVLQTPRCYSLELEVGEYKNSWNIYVYPRPKPVQINQHYRLTTRLDSEIIRYLTEGGKVLLSLGKDRVSENWGGQVGVGFSSIFWNTAWTGGQKPHTLGILCNPDHPALNEFPTSYHSDWNWWDMMAHADAIQLDSLKNWNDPIVRIIDDWVSNRQLALVIEAKVGKGTIIISGADLHSNLENRPAASQFQQSLLKYLQSEKCNPNLSLTMEQLTNMVKIQ